MEDEEDDLYGGPSAPNGQEELPPFDGPQNGNNDQMKQEDEEEDGEEDDDSESDIDIITERKDEPAPQTQSFKRVKQEPVRISSAETIPTVRQQGTTSVKAESSAPAQKATPRDGSKYPEFRTSNIDVNGVPIYDPAGKLITDIDLDADIAAETKPWRVPGTDPTDFFNYGFDEFTWVQYSMRQNTMREQVNGLKEETKQLQTMFAGPQPGMGAMPPMPGMDGMNPEMMNAMFNSMQQQGLSDPSQLDFDTFMQHMGGMGMPGMPGAPSGPGGNFGGQQMQQQGSGQGYGNQSPFPMQQQQQQQQRGQSYGGGTPQPQQQNLNAPAQSFDGYSPQQMAMLQQQQGGGGGRGRGRGRRW